MLINTKEMPGQRCFLVTLLTVKCIVAFSVRVWLSVDKIDFEVT